MAEKSSTLEMKMTVPGDAVIMRAAASTKIVGLNLPREKGSGIELAIQVYQVEEEMRGLLEETSKNKRSLEEKIRQLACALCEIQQEL